MKLLLLLLLVSSGTFAAGWDAMLQIPGGEKIEITTRDGVRTRSQFVSASGDMVVVHEKSGERSVARGEIRRVRVYDRARRIRKGILWTAVGAGVGAGGGAAACPSCPNEGHGYKYVGPGVGIGAAIGALGFLSSPYRTVYKDH